VVALLLFLLSLALMLWSVAVMAKVKLSVFPEPGKNTRLITAGPYRWIRHPMYTSLLLGDAGLLITDPAWWRLLVYAILVVVLILKLQYEEQLLSAKFPEYNHYKTRSYRLIPFIV